VSFFSELKRRNVFRVGIAYTVAAWLVAQVLQMVFASFGTPGWAMKSVLVVLALGLPVALVFAWVYELTPEGLRREASVDPAKSITLQTARKLDRAIIVVLVLALGYFAVDKFLLAPAREQARLEAAKQQMATAVPAAEKAPAPASGAAAEEPSIAVLPFVNMSDDKDYFADGLSEELLNMLANIPGLKVAGRTSSFMFKGHNEDLREIGEKLGVANVLEGSVRRSGERLRITAQLVKAEDGFHIWSETYDRQMADVFDIQDDVARAISEALKVHLLAPEERPTENTEAYALYLEAVAMMQGTDWSRVLQDLDSAIALDPNFAKAWELKAAYYWFNGNSSTIATSEAQGLVFDAASHALALDPDLAAARAYAATSDAVFSMLQEYDALSELVRLQPNNLIGIDTLRWDMAYMGYFARALELADRALAIDPLSPTFPAGRGDALMALGRREEGFAAWQLGVERGDPTAALRLADAEILAGNDPAGVAWLKRYLVLRDIGPWDARAFIAHARDPATGKAFLDEQITGVLDRWPASVDDLNRMDTWYLVFGYLDDYWRVMEGAGIFSGQGWSDADSALLWGTMFHESGFTARPEYQRFANQYLAEVWEAHGAPDLCRKAQEQWVCE